MLWLLFATLARVGSRLRVGTGDNLQDAVDRMLPSLRDPGFRARLRRFARNLALVGHRNSIICIGEISNIHPIVMPFEPIDWESGGAPPVSGDPGCEVPDVAGHSWLKTRLGRPLRFHAAILTGATLLAFCLFTMLRAMLSGMTVSLAFILAMIAIAIVLVHSVRQAFGDGWRVVPGAMVKVERLPLAGRRLRLLRRSDIVVVAYRATIQQWTIVLSDGRSEWEVAGSRAEVEFALRALSSPIPPPDPDMLESLALPRRTTSRRRAQPNRRRRRTVFLFQPNQPRSTGPTRSATSVS